MTISLDDIWGALDSLPYGEEKKELYKEYLDLLDEKYGLYDEEGNIGIDKLFHIRDNTTKNEWFKFLKNYNRIIDGLSRKNGHYGQYVGFIPKELNKMVYSDIDTKYPVRKTEGGSSLEGSSLEGEISGSVKRPKWNIPLNPVEENNEEETIGEPEKEPLITSEEETIGEPVEESSITSDSESVEGESSMVPVENQLKIINSMESILKNIQERPLEEVIGDLSSIVPLITDSELSDRMDSYLVDKLSTLKDSRGELLFRDTGEIMNFIQLLKGNRNKRYKLPVKVDKEIRREGIDNMKPSVMISRVQSHVNHLKSQQNRYYW